MSCNDDVIAVRQLTKTQRTSDAFLSIDPGFVNFRKIETVLGPRGMQFIDQERSRMPPGPAWQEDIRLAHLYTQYLLTWCRAVGVPPLSRILAQRSGRMFCSTEELAPAPEVHDAERAVSRIVSPGFDDLSAELHYSTKHIGSDTTRSELHEGGPMAVIAEQRDLRDGVLIFHPLVMGAPWLNGDEGKFSESDSVWYSWSFFEQVVEDIDEFAKVTNVPVPTDFSVMKDISESAFKRCLGEILGEATAKDWGGEQSDHYSAHLHLNGRPITAAFLLKGPAHFAPMRLNHLGKNNDQIYRLSMEPAELLIVQHSHDITPAVRATLRAFAVQPAGSRRYCLIDGRDSLRLLTAYNKVERARELSQRG